jgi:hypothetical protein
MSASFTLTLDTTGPAGVAGSINSGAVYATARAVTLAPTTTDPDTTGYQIKIWGDVDLAANANIQDTEANSSWITLTASMAVTLSTGDGAKNLTWRLRDDVNNTSATATDSITLDTTLPVATIQSGPDVAKVSKQTGKDTCSVTWQANSHIQAYKIKVVPLTTSLESAGTQIPTTAGSTNMSGGPVNATTNVTSTIKGTDLETASSGDGAKVVKIFVQDDAGNWSTAA